MRAATDLTIDVMARVVLASGIHHADWEDYPEIGENDWDAIIERATELARGPSAEAFKQAYDHLTARAHSPHGAQS